MRWFLRLLLAGWCLAALAPVRAHEFWMLPGSFLLRPGQATLLSLAVGQDFSGDAVAFAPDFVVQLRHLALGTDESLAARTLPGAGSPGIGVRPLRAGTHLYLLDTETSRIELPADRFNEYLLLEGLQEVLAARARAGTSETPGRERFRRHVKTLVQVGAASDDTHGRSTGQRLEIVPEADPFKLGVPGTLPLRVLFDGQPLPRVLVKLWHGSGPGALSAQGRTGVDGRVSLAVPVSGAWMASVVHMLPAQPADGVDWDSYWGNLTFGVRPAAAQDEVGSSALRR